MVKILVIGQAPPAVKQSVPYDTTMLYEMLSWAGITKEQAQEMFEWEAVFNAFPGYDESGHKKPTKEQMDEHWNKTLCAKFITHKKIIVLGKVAVEYLSEYIRKYNNTVLLLIHPSKRNYSKIMGDKEKITSAIKIFITL